MFSGRGKKNERQDKKKKNRFSSEYTMLSILEYLYTNSRRIPVTKYNIVTNTPGIKQQRPDRVSIMINSLEKNGYVISVNTSSSLTFYKITQSGIEAYEKWIKDFLEFARNTNITTPETTYTTAEKESMKKNSGDDAGDVMMIVW
jgi:DNA-binding PadR family transcriptional regulator